MKRTAMLAAVMILLAGCGSAPPPTDSTPSSASVTPTQAAPTPTAATPAQWASRIAANGGDWRENAEQFSSDCGWVAVVLRTEPVTCGLQLLTLEFSGAAAAAVMTGAVDDLGAPPAEIESLVDGVRNAGTALEQAAKAVPEDCPSRAKKCGKPWVTVEMAADRFAESLAAWQPYL